MSWRVTLLTLAIPILCACGPAAPARSSECNAIVNRCMESCRDEPEAISPREQSVATGNTTSVASSPCEQRCSSKCK